MNAIPYRTPTTEPSTEELRNEQVRTDPAGHPAVRRILARHTGEDTPAADPARPERAGGPATPGDDLDGEQFDLADRQALRRVAGLSTELEDVSEVEYRRLRLERVVLAGLWSGGGGGASRSSTRVPRSSRSALNTPPAVTTSSSRPARTTGTVCRWAVPAGRAEK